MFMVELALQHVEQDCRVRLHRAYKMVAAEGSGGASAMRYVGAEGETAPPPHRTEGEAQRSELAERLRRDRASALRDLQSGGGAAARRDVVLPTPSDRERARRQFEEQQGITELKLTPGAAGSGSSSSASTAAASASSASSSSSSAAPKRPLIMDITPGSSTPSELDEPESAARASAPIASVTAATARPSAAAAASAVATPAPAGADARPLLSMVAKTVKVSGGGSGDAPPSSTSAAAPTTTLPTPHYTMRTLDDGVRMEVVIHLPGIRSAAEVTLDIARSQMHLSGASHYAPLTIVFPTPIDESGASARFSKKFSTLTISGNVVNV
jgi:hypothetical protein